MDIKELNKTQLILLTLLITFVVSIATGIITVSLMQQAPKSVPQTINNVIQRTIEKVTTVPTPTPADTTKGDSKDSTPSFADGNAMISIYSLDGAVVDPGPGATTQPIEPKPLGQGIIISDVGLVLVDSTILTDKDAYKVILNKVDFDATVIKRFGNGFAILKITQKKSIEEKKDDKTPTTSAEKKP
jgi:hypothetical protein